MAVLCAADLHEDLIHECQSSFASRWGWDKEWILDFTYTHYYEKEMGVTPQKRIWFGSEKILFEEIAPMKDWSEHWETEFLKDQKRLINLDPGIISTTQVVLATFKNFAHRVPIGDDIFADVQLLRIKGKWTTLPWTYYDYKSFAERLNSLT